VFLVTLKRNRRKRQEGERDGGGCNGSEVVDATRGTKDGGFQATLFSIWERRLWMDRLKERVMI
jgi:hypothetical protein